MFGFIKKIFIGLLTSKIHASNHTKCVSLSNQKCTTQPTLIKLHPNECTQGLRYNPLSINSGRCVSSCNILNDLPNKVCLSKNSCQL